MRTLFWAKRTGHGALLAALLVLAASCAGGGGGVGQAGGSLYTPVHEGQAIGPLPGEPIPFYPYQPREIRTLDELPADVRARAEAHVRQRIGEESYRRLRFAGGQFVDRDELARVNPASRQFRQEVPAYRLKFGFTLGAVGIRLYTASVSLRRDGTILTALDFPTLATDPGKLTLKPLADAAREAAQQGLIDPSTATATITYDRQRDDFLWHFEQVLPGNGPEVRVRTVEIDARTGEIVRRS